MNPNQKVALANTLQSMKDGLPEMRGRWQQLFDEVKIHRVALDKSVKAMDDLSVEIADVEKNITQLRDMLKLPLSETVIAPPIITYDRRLAARLAATGSSSKRYDVQFVLCIDPARPYSKYFVFECECPSFRFTKGELSNGKTCKHIERYQGRTVYKEAKEAANKAFRIQRGDVDFSINYNHDYDWRDRND